MIDVSKKHELDDILDEALDELEQDEPAKDKPKPGDAGYDWAAVYGTDDLYIHTFSNGKVVALKAFTSIFDEVWLFKNRKLDDTPLKFNAIERGACPAAQAVLESLPDDGSIGTPISDLFSAWTSAATGGLTPGE